MPVDQEIERGSSVGMNLLFPTCGSRMLGRMLLIATVGALMAGSYGIVHDQITYSISPEYFTNMKFNQFRAANFGFPPRVFVGEIGFLATWWIGLLAGWFYSRIAVPAWPLKVALRQIGVAFGINFGVAFLAGLTGWVLGPLHSGVGEFWSMVCSDFGVRDMHGFVTVAYIHYGGYLGGAVGLLLGILYLDRLPKVRA